MDWNKTTKHDKITQRSRIFYRCVDWNTLEVKTAIIKYVASFTDAWIETLISLISEINLLVASFTDAWIETPGGVAKKLLRRRIFYRCVDWNCALARSNSLIAGRIFYRCVDWNRPSTSLRIFLLSHLLQMRGLKHIGRFIIATYRSRIFYRCVDWNCNHQWSKAA